MIVKEVVQLEDGRNIIVNLTEQEHTYLLSFAINNMVAMGMMAMKDDESGEIIGDPNPEGDVPAGEAH